MRAITPHVYASSWGRSPVPGVRPGDTALATRVFRGLAVLWFTIVVGRFLQLCWEGCSMRLGRVLLWFPPRLLKAFVKRVWHRYFVQNFEPVSVFLTSGLLLCGWSLVFGGYSWASSIVTGVPATAGTVMLSAMPFLTGFQLLLQATVMDISDQPTQPLCRKNCSEQPNVSGVEPWSRAA